VDPVHVRFLFGLPFAMLSIAALQGVTGFAWPALPATFWAWTAFGALSQIAGTALMLAAMRERSFVVATAYMKTEPIQVAVFAGVFLGDRLGGLALIAILVATVGVVLVSRGGAAAAPALEPSGRLRPALFGIASGAMLALASVGFRGGILALGDGWFVAHATVTLVCGLAIQTLVLSGWLALRSLDTLRQIFRAWRPSLLAGFMGAAASQMWFLAFALETAARVRTVGLVEILFAQVLSRRLFAQGTSRAEGVGIALIVAGVVLLVAV
jgi:drug/metabolite transporter (DMT)-like permease